LVEFLFFLPSVEPIPGPTQATVMSRPLSLPLLFCQPDDKYDRQMSLFSPISPQSPSPLPPPHLTAGIFFFRTLMRSCYRVFPVRVGHSPSPPRPFLTTFFFTPSFLLHAVKLGRLSSVMALSGATPHSSAYLVLTVQSFTLCRSPPSPSGCEQANISARRLLRDEEFPLRTREFLFSNPVYLFGFHPKLSKFQDHRGTPVPQDLDRSV